MSLINYGKQFLDKDDFNSVKKVLGSDNLTQGPTIKRFEEKLKEKLGSKYFQCLRLYLQKQESLLHIKCNYLLPQSSKV